MNLWPIWLVLAVALGVVEIFTLTAVLGLLGVAALATAGAAALGLPVLGQLLVFPATALAGLVLLRPIAVRHLLNPPRPRTERLAGRSGEVTREVSAGAGVVRIDGEEWSARPLDELTVIHPGATVDVLYIDGITAVIHPREKPWS